MHISIYSNWRVNSHSWATALSYAKLSVYADWWFCNIYGDNVVLMYTTLWQSINLMATDIDQNNIITSSCSKLSPKLIIIIFPANTLKIHFQNISKVMHTWKLLQDHSWLPRSPVQPLFAIRRTSADSLDSKSRATKKNQVETTATSQTPPAPGTPEALGESQLQLGHYMLLTN